MAKTKSDLNDGQQSIEKLQQRYATLNEKKIAAETELRGAEKRLKDLQKEAREKYETDDVAKLLEMLENLKKENEEKRANYQASLDRIESDLAAAEEKFSVAQSHDVGDTGK